MTVSITELLQFTTVTPITEMGGKRSYRGHTMCCPRKAWTHVTTAGRPLGICSVDSLPLRILCRQLPLQRATTALMPRSELCPKVLLRRNVDCFSNTQFMENVLLFKNIQRTF